MRWFGRFEVSSIAPRDSAHEEAADQIAGQDGVAVVVPTVEFGREQRRVLGPPTSVDPQVEPVAPPYDVRAAIDEYQIIDRGNSFDEIAVIEVDESPEKNPAAVATVVEDHEYGEVTVRAIG